MSIIACPGCSQSLDVSGLSHGSQASCPYCNTLIALDFGTPEVDRPVFHYYTKIAGVSHNNDDGSSRQAIIRRCQLGEQLQLAYDEGNKYDKDAVRVFRTNGETLGYIGKHLASEVANHGRAGYRYAVFISSLTGGTRDKPHRGVNILVMGAHPSVSDAEAQQYIDDALQQNPDGALASGAGDTVASRARERSRNSQGCLVTLCCVFISISLIVIGGCNPQIAQLTNTSGESQMESFKLIQCMANTDEGLIQDAEELDKAIDHVVQLIQDSCALYFKTSYPSSTFLSITACEEVAKAHFGIFSDGKHPEKKGRNIFRDHKTKHLLAAMPTVPMGSRLEDALGQSELKRLMNMAHNAGFVQTREDALYFQRENERLVVPSEKIDRNLARSMLLFAIEIFDDALVGMTDLSYRMDDITDAIFEQVKNS